MNTLSATYSPDDNKLRLYSATRLDKETYERVKDAGFRWAPSMGAWQATINQRSLTLARSFAVI